MINFLFISEIVCIGTICCIESRENSISRNTLFNVDGEISCGCSNCNYSLRDRNCLSLACTTGAAGGNNSIANMIRSQNSLMCFAIRCDCQLIAASRHSIRNVMCCTLLIGLSRCAFCNNILAALTNGQCCGRFGLECQCARNSCGKHRRHKGQHHGQNQQQAQKPILCKFHLLHLFHVFPFQKGILTLLQCTIK